MKKLSELYHISRRGNMRNEASKGFVRPTVKQVWAPYKKYFNEIISRKLEGGIVTTYTEGQNTYEVHTFLSSGELIVRANTTVDYLIVGGGGSGARGGTNACGGGGGAGGMLTGTMTITKQRYNIVVGAGGDAYTSDYGGSNSGENSSAFGLIAFGGGGGKFRGMTDANHSNGGSGGGASFQRINNDEVGGNGISGQGHNGGMYVYGYYINGAGGGGGAGQNGVNAVGDGRGGGGGNGIISSITGQPIYYAGGGGGGSFSNNINNVINSCAYGGIGGGGNGGYGNHRNESTIIGIDAQPNTGGGGGGTAVSDDVYIPGYESGAGGSGIVIVRYKI